ncbi:hypothetical protein J6590_071180 [Homalodisca vitripennis]|nr:hypothetical protein J6590_071180 [Homalodisca vitripennis]
MSYDTYSYIYLELALYIEEYSRERDPVFVVLEGTVRSQIVLITVLPDNISSRPDFPLPARSAQLRSILDGPRLV